MWQPGLQPTMDVVEARLDELDDPGVGEHAQGVVYPEKIVRDQAQVDADKVRYLEKRVKELEGANDELENSSQELQDEFVEKEEVIRQRDEDIRRLEEEKTTLDEEKRSLVLTRTSGHGFLEFVGSYTLKPQGNGATYLQYMVELVPCPVFPLPLVEAKIRKEVPKMLLAVRDAARRRSSSS